MKKIIISLLLVLALTAAFTACSGGGEQKVSTQTPTASSENETANAPETEEKPVTTEEPAPVTTEEPVVTEEPAPKFYGDHTFYATNGAYGMYWQFTVSADSESLESVHTFYTVTEYDGSGAINTSENAIKHADISYAITEDGKLEIKFANYLADGSQEGSDYWFSGIILVGLDGQNSEDFDFETDHILVVYFE